MAEIAGNKAARKAWNYPLFDATLNRRPPYVARCRDYL